MATVVWASEYQITVTNTNSNVTIAGKTYSAYKLFDLTLAADNNADGKPDGYAYSIDSDGDGAWAWDTIKGTVNSTTGVYTNTTLSLTFTPSTADPSVYVVTSTMNDDAARVLADALKDAYSSGTAKTGTVAAGAETVTIDVGEGGYNLVYGQADDKADGADNKKTVTAALALTSTEPTATVNPKVDAPSVDKYVSTTATVGTDKAADVNVGDTVYSKVASAVPANMNGYSATNPYKYIFHDTMSNGLTFNAASVSVSIGGNPLAATAYTLNQNPDDDCTFEITIANLAIYDESAAIEITYNATLNDNALTTSEDDNTVKLEYSNNPYDESTGETIEKKVYVYDFDIVIDDVRVKSIGTFCPK